MRQTPIGRSAPLLPCGKGWPGPEEAAASARGQVPGAEPYQCLDQRCGKWHVRNPRAAVFTRQEPRRRDTGFPAAVKLLIRTRAGGGDPNQARCEHCGAFLGGSDGEFQHIVARGMGGTRSPVLSTAANGSLLCPWSHRLAESRSPQMEAAGFWLRQGTDPRLVPMMLASPHGSGVLVWRSEDGRYLPESPEAAA